MKKDNNRISSKMGVMNILICSFLVLYCILMIVLFVWGVFTSFKTRNDFYYNKLLWPKQGWAWSNYATVMNNFSVVVTNSQGQKVQNNVWNQLFNTIFYAGGIALVKTAVNCIVAYMITKFNYKFSKLVYTLIVVSMVIPIIGATPRLLLFLNDLGLYDTWLGIYIMNLDFLNMYCLIFCGIYSGISSDYSAAAKIDGASEFRILFNIMIPMVMPTFATVFLLYFITYWNEYQNVILFFKSHPTLAYGVYAMSVSRENDMSSEPIRIASCMILAVPILIVFVIFRNKLMGNVTMGGIKE